MTNLGKEVTQTTAPRSHSTYSIYQLFWLTNDIPVDIYLPFWQGSCLHLSLPASVSQHILSFGLTRIDNHLIRYHICHRQLQECTITWNTASSNRTPLVVFNVSEVLLIIMSLGVSFSRNNSRTRSSWLFSLDLSTKFPLLQPQRHSPLPTTWWAPFTFPLSINCCRLVKA